MALFGDSRLPKEIRQVGHRDEVFTAHPLKSPFSSVSSAWLGIILHKLVELAETAGKRELRPCGD
jgi:hypothetical protein